MSESRKGGGLEYNAPAATRTGVGDPSREPPYGDRHDPGKTHEMIPDREGQHYECLTCKRQRQTSLKYVFEKRKRERAAATARDLKTLEEL